MTSCLLCKKEFEDSAYTICFDPHWKRNMWGGDSHEIIGNICADCGDRLLIVHDDEWKDSFKETPERELSNASR